MTSHTAPNLLYKACDSSITTAGSLSFSFFERKTAALVLFSGSPVVSPGGSATYTAQLGSAPATNIVVTPGQLSQLTISPSSLTFTNANWSSAQTFTVSAQATLSSMATTPLKISHTVTGDTEFTSQVMFVPTFVSAVVVRQLLTSVLLSGDLVFKEGRMGSYGVVLSTQPSADVTVTFALSNAFLQVISPSPAQLVFTSSNYSTAQRVTLAAISGAPPADFSYSTIITHTVTSSDLQYHNSTPLPSATLQASVVNLCPLGFYSHPPGAGVCLPCPQGYSCASVYQSPVACGAITYSPYGEWRCLSCPAGYACSGSGLPTLCEPGTQADVGTGICTNCAAGTPCGIPDGSDTATCEAGTYMLYGDLNCSICPAGFSCAGGAAAPAMCSIGTFSSQGSSACSSPIANFFAFDPIISSDRVCPLGSYSSAAASACTTCPAGSSCPPDTGSVTACAGTTYSLKGWGKCSACGSGNCGSHLSDAMCALTESVSGSNSCVTCVAGKVCDGYLARPALPGFYTGVGASAPTLCGVGSVAAFGTATSCTAATTGQFSIRSDKGVQSCSLGTYSSATSQMACFYCLPGYTCGAAATSATAASCQNGYYCHPATPTQQIAGSTTPCPAGTTLTGANVKTSDYTLCSAGNACAKADSTNNTPCSAGFFCLTGSQFAEQYWCPAGTYSATTSALTDATCLACTATFYCPQSSSAAGRACWAGNYCPASSPEPVRCPMGTFTESTTLSASSGCTTCTAGSTCAQGSLFALQCPLGSVNGLPGGLTTFKDCILCVAGKACSSLGMTVEIANSCGRGAWCKEGTRFADEFPCPAGTQSDSQAINAPTSCLVCDAGHYCLQGTSATEQKPVKCPRGTLCVNTDATYPGQYPCAAGTYNAGLGTSAGTCTSCPVGHYCARGAFVSTDQCAPGFFCSAGTARDDEHPCLASTYSSSQKLTQDTECTDCPSGNYCFSGSATPRPCPPGTYRGSIKATQPSHCVACTGGSKCPSQTTAPVACGLGYTSPSGSFTCSLCPAGAYCSTTTTNNAAVNAICPAGKYCGKGTASDPTSDANYNCPAGYFCLQGTAIPTPCDPGYKRETAGAIQANECVKASVGYYTVAHADSDTGLCEPGFYCPLGSTGPYAVPCPANTFMNKPGGKVSSDCQTCIAGYYCPLGTTLPLICPAGSYCPANSMQPTLCPIGKLGQTVGLKASSDCSPCPQGYYCSQPGLIVPDGTCAPGAICNPGSTSSTGGSVTPVVCTAGGYCEPGLGIKRNCPSGTYNPNTGAKDKSFCIPCTQTFYCVGSEVNPSLQCPVGYYCPTGTSFNKSFPAPPGTYTPIGSASAVQCVQNQFNNEYAHSSCQTCLAGFYCAVPAIILPSSCPAGMYCGPGVSVGTPCGIGTFNSMTNQATSASCLACTGGTYCSIAGLSLYEGFCDPGFWCTSSSTLKNPETTHSTYGPCPVGYFCLAGSAEPAPCPSGTLRAATLGIAEGDCTNCPAGFYCTTLGRFTTEGPCAAGFFCQTGERINRPHDRAVGNKRHCIAGQYCPAGSTAAINCPAGQYQFNEYQALCNSCRQGFYCTGATGLYTANTCNAGYYCIVGTTTATAYGCSAGQYNPLTKRKSPSECLTCDPGKYCPSANAATPAGDCDPGYFCKIASIVKNPSTPDPGDSNGGMCIPGTYCPAGSSASLQCDGGSYCNASTLSAVVGDCDPGYYCLFGSASKTPSNGINGNACPQGFYCLVKSVSPRPCPIGKYLGSAGGSALASCVTCPVSYYCKGVAQLAVTSQCTAGYYCVAESSEQYPQAGRCTPGHMCPPGSGSENNCVSGYYQDLPLQSDCKLCPGGFYCDSLVSLTTPTTCTSGNYCLAGAVAPTPCIAGTYNGLTGADSLTACITCPPGQWCTAGRSSPNGICSAGYFCKGGATQAMPTRSTEGSLCRPGYFCPAGSTQPTPCSPGSYCATSGLSAVTGPCTAGYYCLEASQTATPMDGVTGDTCPSGYYCPANSSTPTPCPIGTYNGTPGKAVAGDCVTCPAGFYCGSLAATTTSGRCQAGYYCPAGQKTASPDAFLCTPGNYCPSGSAVQVPCPAGTFNILTGQAVCQACPKGFTCAGGTGLPLLCAAGYKCTGGNTVASSELCGNGYFQPFTGQSGCVFCPAGFYCGPGPLTSPTVCPAMAYCPSGTSVPFPCDPGTYTTATGLQLSTQCKYCPVGSYCTGGQIQGNCNAGFYCESGSNFPTPDGYSNTGKAYPCPIGYYCPAGTLLPVPCPQGKFRMTSGGQSVADCTLCQEGYYCILNDPVPKVCPQGSYCPAGSSQPSACNAGTYNAQYLATSAASCLTCPPGSLCNVPGIGISSNYPCLPGNYCLAGAVSPTLSPRAKFSPGSSAGALIDLLSCKGGFYCVEGSVGYRACQAWTYCAPGSYQETLCPGGYFCGNVTVTPSPCPIGWYCPQNSTAVLEFPPTKCPLGAICPALSAEPIYCKPGERAIKAYDVTATTTTCSACPLGTYGDTNHTECPDCTAGFVCLGNTTISTPTDLEVHHGYESPPGHYALEGAFDTLSCPFGTYSVAYGGTSVSSCLACPEQTYQDLEAQTMCRVCGFWANSTSDHTSCQCKGANRVFLASDKSCPCKPSHEYIDISGKSHTESGLQDCQPRVFTRCPTGQLRDQMGDCVSDSDCSDECQGGTGTRSPGLGICQCDKVVDVDSVCNTACRKTAPKAVLTAEGNITVTDPLNATVHVSMALSSMQGFMGKNVCFQNQSCQVRFMDASSGTPTGLYTPLPSIYQRNSTQGRSLQASPTGIPSPVVCINLGETMIFSISAPSHYPQFLSKSLLNTNPDFDYSQLRLLDLRMQAGWTNITLFAFTFLQPGIMLFADAADNSQQVVISVMSDNTTCPDNDKYIQPRTAASLKQLGAKLDEGIVLGVNWQMVYGLIFSLFISILIFTLLFYYYSKLAWRLPGRKVIPYREAQKKLLLEGDGQVRSRLQMYLEVDSDKSTEEEDLARLLFSRPPQVADAEDDAHITENEDVDPAILTGILARIKEANKSLLEQLQGASNRAQEDLNVVLEKADSIGQYLADRIEPFLRFGDRGLLASPDDPRELDEHEESALDPPFPLAAQEAGLDTIIELDDETEQLKRNALKALAVNVDALEGDKQKLMDELSAEYSKMQEAMNQYRDRSENDLKGRLAERNRKRQAMLANKARLEQDTQAQRQNLDVMGRAQEMRQAQEEVKIDQEAQMEQFEQRAGLIGPQAEAQFQALQAKCAADPDQAAEIMHAFERDLQHLEENLSMNQLREKAAIQKRVEERRAKRQKEAAAERAKREQAEHEALQQNLKGLQKQLEDVSVQEAMAAVLPILDIRESESREAEPSNKALDESMESRGTSAAGNRRDAEHDSQQKELENARTQLRDRLATASASEQEALTQELERIQQQINENEAKYGNLKKAELENRLEARRKQRQQRQQENRARQEKEQKTADQRRKVEDDRKRSAALEQALKFAKDSLPAHLYQDVIKALLEEKNDREVAALRKRQGREQKSTQSGLIEEHFRRKANDLKLIRKEFKARRTQMDKTDPDYDIKQEAVTRAEREVVVNLDFTCAKDLEEALEKAWKDLRRRQAAELSDLIDRQIQEARRMQSTEANKAGLEDLERSLAARKTQLEQEQQRKLDTMEQRKGEINRQRQEKQQQLEELIRREREDEERKDAMRKELLKKREFEEKRRRYEEELRRRNISEDKMEQMIEDYQRGIAQAERIQEQERLKQSSIMSQKLAERRRKKQEIQQSLDRIREEQDKWQKKLDGLPGLNAKEANKLLRRWRRYPRKAIKEVASSLSKPAVVHDLPTLAVGSAAVEGDSRMKELLQRVERVESIAKNIEGKQFSQMQKALVALKDKLK